MVQSSDRIKKLQWILCSRHIFYFYFFSGYLFFSYSFHCGQCFNNLKNLIYQACQWICSEPSFYTLYGSPETIVATTMQHFTQSAILNIHSISINNLYQKLTHLLGTLRAIRSCATNQESSPLIFPLCSIMTVWMCPIRLTSLSLSHNASCIFIRTLFKKTENFASLENVKNIGMISAS